MIRRCFFRPRPLLNLAYTQRGAMTYLRTLPVTLGLSGGRRGK